MAADQFPDDRKPDSGFLKRGASRIARIFSASEKQAQSIDVQQAYSYGDGLYSAAYSLLVSGSRQPRVRQQIYQKWSQMAGDAIVSTGLGLLVTAALGGHETTGDVVFIETTAAAKKDKARAKIVEEIQKDLAPQFNRIAYTVGYNGAWAGDGYARMYSEKGAGIVDLYVDEMVNPLTILPFEQGNQTVAYATCIGEKQLDRLSILQIARLKMPRKVFVPQLSITEKAWRATLTQDDRMQLPILPAAVGGSFLYEAETAYDNMIAALIGIVGQRVLDSVDERMLGVQMSGATKEQQEKILNSLVAMLKSSKERAEKAVKEGRPILERIRHIMPIWNEKQLINFDAGTPQSSSRSATISIEDVIMHARILSGCLGVDLSMIGFADQMAGGLGEGGFFRTSAQAAERARVIRASLSDFFNHIIDVHTYRKYGGMVFAPNDRPWAINFYGSISALENEQQTTRAASMNGGLLLAQAMQQCKELGMTKEQFEHYLIKEMKLDEADAKLYAPMIEQAPPGAEDGSEGGDDPAASRPRPRRTPKPAPAGAE
jgi:hypothetical protein